MRIIIGDLSYLHDWDYAQPLPLNAAFVAAYLKQTIPDASVEVFKDPGLLLDEISSAPPTVLALSHYAWTANLDLAVMKRAKEVNPATITVLGGPNFDADTPEWIDTFFLKRPQVDLYITGEGEVSFTRLVELLMNHGGELDRIPRDEWPASFYSFDPVKQTVIHNPLNPIHRMPLNDGKIPSPYLTGLLDPFLDDERLAPIIETNRGCPYSCAFCNWGQATQSKIFQFPLDRVLDEIRYISERTKNPTKLLYVADGNFGILKRDLEIAETIQACAEKHGFPKNAYIYWAKNTTASVMDIAGTIKSVASMSMSKQSLNLSTLEYIRRKNISIEKYDELRRECERRGIQTFCELIYGLPGESYQSFVDGVIATVRDKQDVVIYPHKLNAGSESATKAFREEFGIKSAFRVLPRYVGTYSRISSLEYEEIVVETNDLSQVDFRRVRLFQFLIFVFGGDVFSELSRGLESHGLDYATLSHLIAGDDRNWTGDWRKLLKSFQESARNEMLSEQETKFYFNEDAINGVEMHELALNPSYLARLVSSSSTISDLRTYLRSALERFLGSKIGDAEMEDLLEATDLSFDRIIHYDDLQLEKVAEYDYDIDAWLATEESQPLADFRLERPVRYRFVLDDDILPSLKQAKAATDDLAQAVYILRMNILWRYGNRRVYGYQRRSDSAERDLAQAQTKDASGRPIANEMAESGLL